MADITKSFTAHPLQLCVPAGLFSSSAPAASLEPLRIAPPLVRLSFHLLPLKTATMILTVSLTGINSATGRGAVASAHHLQIIPWYVACLLTSTATARELPREQHSTKGWPSDMPFRLYLVVASLIPLNTSSNPVIPSLTKLGRVRVQDLFCDTSKRDSQPLNFVGPFKLNRTSSSYNYYV